MKVSNEKIEQDGSERLKQPYLTKQIITYMGNKRKLLPALDNVFSSIETQLGRKLRMGDGFSGSGIVSRLMTLYASEIYTNDLAGYSETLNKCFLKHKTKKERNELETYINAANDYVDNPSNTETYVYVQKHWSPTTDNIKPTERVYFTAENGKRIDKYKYFIDNFTPEKYQPCLLAILLIEASIKNNTSGHFAAYYKKDDVGHYGGKKELDLHRIAKQIRLIPPVYNSNIGTSTNTNTTTVKTCITRMDTNDWATTLNNNDVTLDVVYYDPPYNKHPYNIYYFLLDIINNWDTSVEIPDTTRGQPKNWKRSAYNSISNAKKSFADLIENTRSKYIVVSYNSKGIISKEDMMEILGTRGNVMEYTMEHKVYNRMVGIAKYKADETKKKISEYLFVVETGM